MSGVLDFLSPSLARDEGGFHPVARSAAERLFRAADATFEERDGWLVPTAVPGEADHLSRVGIADLSHLGKLDVRPAPPADLEGDGVTTYRLSPRRALVLYPQTARAAVGEQAAGRRARHRRDRRVHGAGAHGPDARALLARLTHLHHFPCGGEVAHVTAHVLPVGRRIPARRRTGARRCTSPRWRSTAPRRSAAASSASTRSPRRSAP